MAQDISNEFVSQSYQNLVLVSASNGENILADALGNVFVPVSASTATTATTADTAAFATNATSASYAATASFALNVPTVDTGSLLQTASISDATITFEKADATTFDLTVNNVVSASHAVASDTSISASHALASDTSISASHALNADASISASHAVNADTAISSSHALAADTAISASHAVNADIAISSSHALNSDNSISASRADSAALADLATLATNSTYADNTIVIGKALELLTIPKGAPVYFADSGTSGNLVGLYLADAGNPARMPAGGIAGENIAPGDEGIVLLDGYIGNVNTSLFGEGDEVFVAVGGGYTNEAPTGAGNLIQKLGNIEKVDINGSGVIQMDGEARGLPNLTQDNVWVGDVNDVPQETAVNTLSVATASLALGVNSAANLNVASIIATNASFTSASIGYLESVTGSAKIIGDAFIILNNNTPAERYAGIAVQDSGSVGVTASLQFDGLSNDWFYEYSDDGGVTTDHGVVLFGPEYNSIGAPTYNTANTILKSDGGHHVLDSIITDDGSTVTVGGDITANIIEANTYVVGDLVGNASTATTASYAVSAGTAVSASHALVADSTNQVANSLTDGNGITDFTFNGSAAATVSVQADGSTLTVGASGVKVSETGITAIELNPSVAGNGLSGGAGTALNVNVDDSTIAISVDTLLVKDGGITTAKFAAGATAPNATTALYAEKVEFTEDNSNTNYPLPFADSLNNNLLVNPLVESGQVTFNPFTELLSVTNIDVTDINSLAFPTSDGTNGQAIVTDGAGNLSFQDVAGDPQGATSTGTTLSFDNAIGTVYNTAASPATGNLTLSTTGAIVGSSVVIYHDDTAEPTVSGMTVDKVVGSYDVDALNVITFIHVGSNHVIQTIAGADVTGIITNSTDTYTGTDACQHITTLTQAEYDAIGTPDANTLYVIV